MSPHKLVLHRIYWHEDCPAWEVDIEKSTWFGDPIKDLGAFGRRRFENWVILERPKERIKVIYR